MPTQTPHRSVLAQLTHTAPRFKPSLRDKRPAPECYPSLFRGHVHGFRCTRRVSLRRPLETASPWLRGVLRSRSPASSLLWDAPTPCRPSRRTSLPSFGDTVVLSPLRPHQPGTGAGDQPGVGKPGLQPAIATEVAGPLRFPSGPHVPAPCSWTPVGPEDAQPLRRLGTAAALSTAAAPTTSHFGARWHGIGTGCRRFAVAVARPRARLASGCWLGSTGRDC